MKISVQGHELYAYTGGKPFNPAQPTAVFIHGVLNDHSVWILQTRYMAHHGWNVLAIDLPGHCKSEGTPPQSVEEAADTVIALLKAGQISNFSPNRCKVRHTRPSLRGVAFILDQALTKIQRA